MEIENFVKKKSISFNKYTKIKIIENIARAYQKLYIVS